MSKIISSKKYLMLILLIISIKFSLTKNNSIILPFNIYQPKEYDFPSKNEIFEFIEKDYIYSIFKMGNPPKELPGFYNLYDSNISIYPNSNNFSPSESLYIPNDSKTFISLENNHVQDELIINTENQKIIKNFTFLYSKQSKTDKNLYLSIGIQNFYKEYTLNKIENPNFLYQLKEQGLIDCISYSINYTSPDGGFININIDPSEYAPELYSDKKKHTTIVKGVTSKSINKLGEYLWSMDINKLFYQTKENLVIIEEELYKLYEDQYQAILNPRYGVIKGPYLYKKFIERDFFNELKDKEICQLNRFQKRLYYTCKTSHKKLIKEKFPTLYFYHKNFNYTFELNYEDLFYEIGNNLFFLICFDTGMFGDDKFTEIAEWILGKPFLSKYQFSFDVERRRIFFYENLKGYINNPDIHINVRKYIYFSQLFSKNIKTIVLLMLILLIVIFYFKYYNQKKNSKINRETKIDKNEKGKEYIELEDTLIK